jgi:hypothetical protein
MTSKGSKAELAKQARRHLDRLAKERGVEPQRLHSEYAVERLLYRLGISVHAGDFVLKGATVLRLWTPSASRATWDLDLLGRGSSAMGDVLARLRAVAAVEAQDGIVFSVESMNAEEIRAADEYGGVRVRGIAQLGPARIPIQVDVGFGDAVLPPPEFAELEALAKEPPPRVLVYPKKVVVAEKLEAVASLGMLSSRMKDFYDLDLLARSCEFDGERLLAAVRATFARRGTPLPEDLPVALRNESLALPERAAQWRAFAKRSRLPAPDVAALATHLAEFIAPLLARGTSAQGFPHTWPVGGPWIPSPPGKL